jgi:hypothetical protein
MKPRVSHHKTAALTLVEVVLILSVLAILLAVLLPFDRLAGENPPAFSLSQQNRQSLPPAMRLLH